MSPKEISIDKSFYRLVSACTVCGQAADRGHVACECGSLLVEGLQNDVVIAGRYKYIDTIGNGGMGLVVRAYDTELNCDVAVKLLVRNSHSAEVMRFMQECRATNSLVHDSIVRVSDFGVTNDGFPFMVMEYLSGEDLGTLLSRRGSLPVDEALDIFQQLCRAVSYAHKQGVIHRDIKPSNIVLLPDGMGGMRVKLVDFGIAKVVYPDGTAVQANLTQTGVILGSPTYMSPEQAMGKKIDQRTDIYSAGCVLYHCLTGAPPIQGTSAIETLFRHVNEAPVSLSQASMGAKFSDGLEHISARALQKSPEERYQSFDELLSDVRALSKGETLSPTAASANGQKSDLKIAIACGAGLVALTAGLCFWIFGSFNSTGSPVKPKVEANDETSQTASNMATDRFFDNGANRPIIDKLIRDNATDISLTSSMMDDVAVRYLIQKVQEKKLPLVALNLSHSGITSAALKDLAASRIALKKLSLVDTDIDDEGLKALSKMDSIEALDISGIHVSKPSSLDCLRNLKRLEMLSMQNMKLDSPKIQDFAFLESLRSLNRLTIAHNRKLPPDTFKYLSGLPQLNRLLCDHCNLNDRSLSYIGVISSLDRLTIIDDEITDDGIAKLDGLNKLQYLQIGGKQLTPKCFASLKKLKALYQLRISDVQAIKRSDVQKLAWQTKVKVEINNDNLLLLW
ncbi:MAG TPA: protein kinase [Chroococcales cyanobacterium]